MRKTLTLAVAASALAAAAAIPAWSAAQSAGSRSLPPSVALAGDGGEQDLLRLASGEDEDDRHGYPMGGRHGGGEDDEDDDGDGHGGSRGARSPAPAGTVAPPPNGLFGNGAPPQVQVN
ncbi:hypothetical protein [Mangrovicoccus sp. HB161399]|uniref:hypothetical protein n=1 Tax=Mangrovicoccus sp. HB161399 TaxID=2720392 RepID=UPI001553F420|nr:hypothetical protein [Mangrovicoccus sp. HB161399]